MVIQALPRFLEEGDKLAGLSQRQLEDLAWGLWAAQHDVHAALCERSRHGLDGG
jgi:hypothetical protein